MLKDKNFLNFANFNYQIHYIGDVAQVTILRIFYPCQLFWIQLSWNTLIMPW